MLIESDPLLRLQVARYVQPEKNSQFFGGSMIITI